MPSSSRTFVVVAGLTAIMSGASAPVYAQNPFRSFSGLFGGRPGGQQEPRETLDLSLVALQAYDDNLLADQPSLSPSAEAIGGWFTMFGADGIYNWRGKRSQVGVTGGSVVRYYNDAEQFNASYSVGAGFSTEFASRTSFSANQSVAYSPSYLTGLFPSVQVAAPGDSTPVGANYAVDDTSSFQYVTTARVSRGLTRRGTISGTAEYTSTDFLQNEAGRVDQSNTAVRVQFARAMSRYSSLNAAYRYRNGDMGSPVIGATTSQNTVENGFDVGVDYSRPLSATRRMFFTFAVGSSAARFPGDITAADEQQYSVVADASFGVQFARSWETRATYRRGLAYIAELAEPVYSNGLTATLNGLLSRNLDLSLGAAVSNGDSVVVDGTSTFTTYTANIRMRRAITRTLAAYLEYVYYYYDFGTTPLQPGVAPSLERNGVRVGVTLWLPVLRR